MRKAARAIIIENGTILLMRRDKEGSQYFTLVGGKINDDESAEAALQRELKEETGMSVTSARLVYIELHPEPYNEQYIYLCTVAPHDSIAIQPASEEELLNRLGFNTHTPVWASLSSFPHVPFRTPHLHDAIITALKKGFPLAPQTI